MIPKDCKRLAEVDFPIAVVSKHAVREKSIRQGHPSTLHLWWARRPLASCRAMLLALLLPDPCDSACPTDFAAAARVILGRVPGCRSGTTDKELQHALFTFIGDFASWNLAADRTYLEASRALVKAAHSEETPLVVDPFAGGGSIPLEALRIGCNAFASDLNPVACLIERVLLEDIPRHGAKLAEELHEAGEAIQAQARLELADFYPIDPDGAQPIAYLWARTVRCEAPSCGAEIPLLRSRWLSKKASRRRALSIGVKRAARDIPRVEFEIITPSTEDEVGVGTVSRAKATCPACQVVLGADRVRAQLAEQHGGADVMFDATGRRVGGARMFAVVTLRDDADGRSYRLPTSRDYEAVRRAQVQLADILTQRLPGALNPVPDEPLPPIGTLGFRVQRYGMLQWGDLFTARQKVALNSVASAIIAAASDRSAAALALVIGRVADRSSSLCSWDNSTTSEVAKHAFARQALPMVWDFVEVNLLSSSTGSLDGCIQSIDDVVTTAVHGVGQVSCGDATASLLSDASAAAWFTDPPYYDAVPYADLSDFFFIWLKRALRDDSLSTDRTDATNPLTPKAQEAVQDKTRRVDGRPKDKAWFEEVMGRAFAEGRRVLSDDGVACVVFAHKTTAGWEALLSGMVRGGWTITGSWPIATEMTTRLRARDSAALATSVHLVCRPRPTDAPVGDWADVARELPRRVADWMTRLQAEGIRGADLVFACIGPALEIYSRYSKVVDAEDRPVPLGGDPEALLPYERGYLAHVWEAVGRAALAQVLGTPDAEGDTGVVAGLEDDARLTALFLWTHQATQSDDIDGAKKEAPDEDDDTEEPDDDEDGGAKEKKKPGLTLIHDVVRRFTQPLGMRLEEWEGRIIDTKKGVVRLLPVRERAAQLFGPDGAAVAAERIEHANGNASAQLGLFPSEEPTPRRRNRRASVADDALTTRREATTLDRIHAALLLQSGGRTHALRALVRGEMDRGPDFERLANNLSALYPRDSEEKRLLDAMLQAIPR